MTDKKLEIKVFGYFDILYNGDSLINDKNQNQKTTNILKYLYVNMGNPVSKENILTNVCADSDYSDENSVIKVYILRLRKYLKGGNRLKLDISDLIKVSYDRRGYFLEIGDEVVSHMDEFDKLCSRIWGEYDTNILAELFNELCSLYNGQFMEDSKEEDWVVTRKNFYARKYCSVVNVILKRLGSENKFTKMIDVSKKSLGIHDLDERIHIHLIQAYLAKGRIDSAVDHYEMIVEKSKKNSVPISSELQELYGLINSSQTRELAGIRLYETALGEISTLIKNMAKLKQNDYLIGYIQIEEMPQTKNSENSQVMELLDAIFRKTLRKNDYYKILDNRRAVIILHKTGQDFLQVTGRIEEEFYNQTTEGQFAINIDIKDHIRVG